MSELSETATTIDALVRLLATSNPGSLSSKHYFKRLLDESDKLLRLTRDIEEEPCFAKAAKALIANPPRTGGASATSTPAAGNAPTSIPVRPVAGESTARV
jgi:hypothetical protein